MEEAGKKALLSKIIIVNHYKRHNEGLVFKKLVEQAVRGMGIEVEISYDDGSLGVWGNYKQALRIPSEPEQFRLILQDDLIIGRNAIRSLVYVLQFMPKDSYVGFYVPQNKAYQEAWAKGHHILKTQVNFWTQAFCFPSARTEDMIQYCEAHVDNEYKYEDKRIAYYSKHNGLYVYTVMPSLFQHLGAYRSIFGFPGVVAGRLKRYSEIYIPEFDVTGVDWERELKDAYFDNSPLVSNIHKFTLGEKNDTK